MPVYEKIPELGAIPVVASGDLLEIVDVSDTTQSPAGSSKNVTPEQLATFAAGLAARNQGGGTLAVATLVYISGGTATLPLLSKADANVAGAIAAYVVDTEILNDANGRVGKTYLLAGINTSGAGAVGDPVYLDTTAGGYTFAAPTDANSRVQIVGRVTIKHASTGAIQFNLAAEGTKKIGTDELQDASVTAAKVAAGAGNPIIAGCTVAADATVTNNKNITSVVRTAPGSGEYTVTVAANAATKYQPQVSLMASAIGGDARSLGVTKNTATIWIVTTGANGAPEDNGFSFTLLSLD